MNVIACAIEKGGTGKTTTAINISATLAEWGKNVLLIDLDRHAGATKSLGFVPMEFAQTIYQVFLEQTTLPQVTIPIENEKFDFVPTNIHLSGAEGELKETETHILAEALSGVENTYDFVILDCPPALGRVTLNALVAADIALIVLQGEWLAYASLDELDEILTFVKQGANPRLETLTVCTLFDTRNAICQDVYDTVKQRAGYTVLKSIIKRRVQFAYASLAGQSIVQYDRNGEGARMYRNLADELCKYLKI